MNQELFESWIKKTQPQIGHTHRYPALLNTISNHLKKNGDLNYKIYGHEDYNRVIELKDRYFSVQEFKEKNQSGGQIYSRSLDLYIQFLKETQGTDDVLSDIEELNDSQLNSTEKKQLILSRVGQGNFRLQLIEMWGCCSVTGYKQLDFLVASHIKPWKPSNNRARLDPFNGLLLTPNIDKAFDKGFITFSESGLIMISKRFQYPERLGIFSDMKINVKKDNLPYLAYHEKYVFRKNT